MTPELDALWTWIQTQAEPCGEQCATECRELQRTLGQRQEAARQEAAANRSGYYFPPESFGHCKSLAYGDFCRFRLGVQKEEHRAANLGHFIKHRLEQAEDLGLPRNLWRWLGVDCPRGERLPSLALDAVREWDRSGDTFLTLCGLCGVGKTAAACAWLWHHRSVGGLLASAAQLRRRNWFDAAAIEPVFSAAHLILDDAGAEFGGSDWQAKMDELITRRDADGAQTIITSNLTPEQFHAALGDRAWDRLTGNGRIVECPGKSLRQKKETTT
jgi:hypothetical protein